MKPDTWHTVKYYDGYLFINGDRYEDHDLLIFFEKFEPNDGDVLRGFLMMQNGVPVFKTKLRDDDDQV